MIAVRRPRVVVLASSVERPCLGSSARGASVCSVGSLVVVNQLNLTDEQLRSVDRSIVFSQTWLERQPPEVRKRAVFTPAPRGRRSRRPQQSPRGREPCVHGGGTRRDLPAVIEALRDTDVPLEVVTFSPATLGWEGELPPNCTVHWRMPVESFLERMARALVVVVPLRDADSDFGRDDGGSGTLAGKGCRHDAEPGIAEYVGDGEEGLLVDAGDVPGIPSSDPPPGRRFGAPPGV